MKTIRQKVNKSIQMNTKRNGRKTIFNVKDLDVLLLNKLKPKDFLKMCCINKSYINICNETFFKNKTISEYPESVPYKDYLYKDLSTKSWKKHYLDILKYVHLLRERKIVYIDRYKSPELFYTARIYVRGEFNVNYVLVKACLYGDMNMVKYLIDIGADVKDEDNRALRVALRHNHLEIAKLLVEKGEIKFLSDASEEIEYAIRTQDLEVLQFLEKFNLNFAHEEYLTKAIKTNNIDIVEFLINSVHTETEKYSQALTILQYSLKLNKPELLNLIQDTNYKFGNFTVTVKSK